MSSSINKESLHINGISDLKLLSINEVRRILGIRHTTVKKLIAENKLKTLTIKNRIKIPIWSLKEFEESQINNIRPNLELLEGKEHDIIQKIINKNLA
jgi:hypothetical protein